MKAVNRRQAIRTLARGAVFGCLGLLTGALSSRVTPAAPCETSCSGAGRCGACPALSNCGLPRGLSARRVLKNGEAP